MGVCYGFNITVKKQGDLDYHTEEIIRTIQKVYKLKREDLKIEFGWLDEPFTNYIEVDNSPKGRDFRFYVLIYEKSGNIAVDMNADKVYAWEIFREEKKYEGFTRNFMKLAHALLKGANAIDGVEGTDVLPEKDSPEKIRHLYSCQFFGKEQIRKIGKKKIMTAPADIVKEVGQGIFVQVDKNQLFSAKGEKIAKAARHLGLKPIYGGSGL